MKFRQALQLLVRALTEGASTSEDAGSLSYSSTTGRVVMSTGTIQKGLAFATEIGGGATNPLTLTEAPSQTTPSLIVEANSGFNLMEAGHTAAHVNELVVYDDQSSTNWARMTMDSTSAYTQGSVGVQSAAGGRSGSVNISAYDNATSGSESDAASLSMTASNGTNSTSAEINSNITIGGVAQSYVRASSIVLTANETAAGSGQYTIEMPFSAVSNPGLPGSGTFQIYGALDGTVKVRNSAGTISQIFPLVIPTWVEVEVDFGSTFIYDKTFTITDATVSGTSKIVVVESGKPATGRLNGDSLWDSIAFTCKAGSGTFTLYAKASGKITGKRNILYQVS